LGIGIFCFLIRRLGFHPGPIGLGFILGPIIEPSLVQALYISDAIGFQNYFLGGVINKVLIALSIISVLTVFLSRLRTKKATV